MDEKKKHFVGYNEHVNHSIYPLQAGHGQSCSCCTVLLSLWFFVDVILVYYLMFHLVLSLIVVDDHIS